MSREHTRNFAVISHVDHGKSTLADRFLELTGTVEKRKMREQVLDAMDLERERGITIKLTPVRMEYRPGSGQWAVGSSPRASAADRLMPAAPYVLNLIDTPGHVDFSYEVSRSLAAVEGAVLLVDATQGIQAQTLANLDLAKRAGLAIVPVVNKIDLRNADIDGVRRELSAVTGVPDTEVLLVSAKNGAGVAELLDAIVQCIPPPRGSAAAPFRALIFDSIFDPYRGVIAYVRVVDGAIRANQPIAFSASRAEATALDVGVFRPEMKSSAELAAGDIGYISTGVRDVSLTRVGDTIVRRGDQGRVASLPGYRVPQPNVYAGIYPVSGEGFPALREAIAKLRLSDASLTVEVERSTAIGQGYRCGFLGLLHLEIVLERLRREYGVEVTLTVPSVAYRVVVRGPGGRPVDTTVRTAAEFPDPSSIERVLEPWVRVTVIARAEDIGAVLQLFGKCGGAPPVTESLSGQRVSITSALPLREVIVDFHDDLKAATSGYASFSLQPAPEREADIVKLSVLVNHEPVEALAVLLPAAKAQTEGRNIVERLKHAIPRHLFPVPLQAALGGTVVARETIPALRKDVTGHLYGGDVTRKRKLLEKQKKGKKRLAARGAVQIPPDAFRAVLTRGE